MAKAPTNQEQLDKEKQAELQAKKKAEQEELEEELAQNKKTTITMINPNQNEEPQEAEVHPDMIKYWEHEGWTVK